MTENNLQKKWSIHLVNYERTNLIICLDQVLTTVKGFNLDLDKQHALSDMYIEFKKFYQESDLVNDSILVQEYTKSYLTTGSMNLIQMAVLTHEHCIQTSDNEVTERLHSLHTQIHELGVKLIGALKQVEPYAEKSSRKLDEDFYADDELVNTNPKSLS